MKNKEIEENRKLSKNSDLDKSFRFREDERDGYGIAVMIAYLFAAIIAMICVVLLFLITKSWIASVVIIGFVTFGIWMFKKLIK